MLARCVLDGTIPVAARRVLEIGCGGAVAAIAAALCGAVEVEANDVDETALHVAGLNAAASGVVIRTTSADYTAGRLPAADVVLVADLFYERGPSERLLARLREASAAGSEVYVGDGGRPFAPMQRRPADPRGDRRRRRGAPGRRLAHRARDPPRLSSLPPAAFPHGPQRDPPGL